MNQGATVLISGTYLRLARGSIFVLGVARLSDYHPSGALQQTIYLSDRQACKVQRELGQQRVSFPLRGKKHGLSGEGTQSDSKRVLKSISFIAVLFLATSAYCQINTVIGATTADYSERYRQTYQIKKSLSPAERGALEAFLRRPPKMEAIEELAAIKNNVADALIAQNVVPDSTLDLFMEMYADAALGGLWHGYIVQKIAELTMRLKSEEKREKAVAFLWNQITDVAAPYGAEAGLGLWRLQRARPDLVSAHEMTARLGTYLANKEAKPEIKRILLQVLIEYDASTARKEAKRFLAEKETGVMLKASAIAALGLAGHAEDRDLIQPFMQSSDIRLSEAASGALRRLQKAQ